MTDEADRRTEEGHYKTGAEYRKIGKDRCRKTEIEYRIRKVEQTMKTRNGGTDVYEIY